ncbi:hypothetical protein VTO42DRAFT_8077 [Malbranchea cinnamomea]
MGENLDERAVELSSIAAIYPELVIEEGPLFKASLHIPISPSAPLRAFFTDGPDSYPPRLTSSASSAGPSEAGTSGSGDDKEDHNDNEKIHTLFHLPPLKLDIELPDGYPSVKPPVFHITTQPEWLPEQVVCKLLVDGLKLWEDLGKDVMVFSYIDHLQQSAENIFGLLQRPDDTLSFHLRIKIPLLDFDAKAQRENFEKQTFVCGICLEPKKGSQCHRLLLCSHVFCVKCLQAFFTACIKEGDVASVKCAAPGCGKEHATEENGILERRSPRRKQDRTLSPSELLQIPLDHETVRRYAFLKRKNKLESDKSTIYCPRKWCQGAARSKKHPKPKDPIADYSDLSDEEGDTTVFDPLGEEEQLPPVTERLAICEDCGYAFCRVCKRGWHGELVYCYPRRQAELTAEEEATVKYMEAYTTPCPSCNARCEKSHGCNHMICFKCGTHFCYLCSSWLFPANPYSHFNNRSNQCYMRLWEGEAGFGLERGRVVDPWDVASNDGDWND